MQDLQIKVAPTIHWTESFASWLYANDRRQKTIEAYLQDLRHFARFFEQANGQTFTPDLLNATDVKAYFRTQDDDHNVAPASRNRRLASLRVMVEWAAEAGVLEYDPTISIKRQPVEPAPRDRSKDEMDALETVVIASSHLRCHTDKHALLGLRDQVMWALFVDAGLRISEIAGLNKDDVNFDDNELMILGKGRKKAPVTVPTRLLDLINTWLDRKPASVDGALVCDWDGERITTGQIRRRLYLIGDTAEVNAKPHDLRHTYAFGLSESMMRQGLTPEKALDAVRKQLRHADRKTTLLYFRARESEIRAAVEAM